MGLAVARPRDRVACAVGERAEGRGPAAPRATRAGPGRLGRIGELPGLPAALLVGAALVLAVLFGFIRLGISDVYTESWLFLALALVLGLASPAAGLVLTLAFIPMDLLAAITRGTLDPLLPALAGQALIVVAAVAARRRTAARRPPGAGGGAGHDRPAHPDVRRTLGYVGAAAVLAGLVWPGAPPRSSWCGPSSRGHPPWPTQRP